MMLLLCCLLAATPEDAWQKALAEEKPRAMLRLLKTKHAEEEKLSKARTAAMLTDRTRATRINECKKRLAAIDEEYQAVRTGAIKPEPPLEPKRDSIGRLKGSFQVVRLEAVDRALVIWGERLASVPGKLGGLTGGGQLPVDGLFRVAAIRESVGGRPVYYLEAFEPADYYTKEPPPAAEAQGPKEPTELPPPPVADDDGPILLPARRK